jgi:hypothetical protein
MNKTLKQDDALMKSLELKTINRIICITDKGTLSLQIRKGDSKYHLVLDSVPLDKEKNEEIMDLLFKVEMPMVNKEVTVTPINTTVVVEPKKKGRPNKK